MILQQFSKNGVLLPMNEAVVPFSNIEYAYGFGVYENVRVTDGHAWFLDDHVSRLMHSARVIDLRHPFAADDVKQWILKLIGTVGDAACNLKILLIGARKTEDCQLIILPLTPLFPDRKLYRDGATAITFPYERMFPQAKTLNMFPSYMAYSQARAKGCYDALLINRDGCVTEGTRTNFFAMNGKTVYSPPTKEILEGVTRMHVLKAALAAGYELTEKDLPLTSLKDYEGVFLTSTSSKIMPLRKIDEQEWSIPETLKELMKVFEQYLNMAASAGR